MTDLSPADVSALLAVARAAVKWQTARDDFMEQQSTVGYMASSTRYRAAKEQLHAAVNALDPSLRRRLEEE